ncbi:MAG: BON domain-containing protein [Burkholderiales bacterium]
MFSIHPLQQVQRAQHAHALVCLALATALCGCGRSNRDAPQTPPTSSSAASATLDATLTARINAELAIDPQLTGRPIQVDTRQASVVLKGSVPDRARYDRATQLARGVPGVAQVDNQLIVADDKGAPKPAH